MANSPEITIRGNMAGDPELRFTSGGHAVASFTVAQTPRSFDKTTQQWVDGETLWVRCTVWRDLAEHVAESLTKGMAVIAHGQLEARSFETKSGEQRTNWELQVEDIGPSLRFATAQVNRPERGQHNSFGQQAPSNTGWGNTGGGGWQ